MKCQKKPQQKKLEELPRSTSRRTWKPHVLNSNCGMGIPLPLSLRGFDNNDDARTKLGDSGEDHRLDTEWLGNLATKALEVIHLQLHPASTTTCMTAKQLLAQI